MTEKEIKKVNKGCLFGWLGSISFFAILIILAIPSFEVSTYPPVFAYKVKNGLRRGIKECFIREAENKTTRFKDAMTFKENYEQFEILPLDPNSCFKAKAVPTNDQNTWFEIVIDIEKGSSKTCGDSSKYECFDGNTWDETMREGFDNMRLMN